MIGGEEIIRPLHLHTLRNNTRTLTRGARAPRTAPAPALFHGGELQGMLGGARAGKREDLLWTVERLGQGRGSREQGTGKEAIRSLSLGTR